MSYKIKNEYPSYSKSAPVSYAYSRTGSLRYNPAMSSYSANNKNSLVKRVEGYSLRASSNNNEPYRFKKDYEELIKRFKINILPYPQKQVLDMPIASYGATLALLNQAYSQSSFNLGNFLSAFLGPGSKGASGAKAAGGGKGGK